MKHTRSLSRLLSSGRFPEAPGKKRRQAELERLQLSMLRIQQGLWHRKRRAVILFEGFDASGKGGAIRRLTENLDPRGFRVHPIGAPSPEEKREHYLARFWRKLPAPGTLAVFDRSWYGRVLVERVEGLAPKARWKQAYREIVELERALGDDGIELIKIFLAIDADEQLRRFEERLADPYKQWKLTEDDVRARSKWEEYVAAVDEMLSKTHSTGSPWHLVPANDKHHARLETLRLVTGKLGAHARWMEGAAQAREIRSLQASLKELQRP
jgi:polyphosphate kinase 2 (PPK2 family)